MCKNLVINVQYWLSYEFPRCATCTILNLACTVQYLSDFFWCLFQFNIKPLLYFFFYLYSGIAVVWFSAEKKSIMADTLTEINENTKMARETALFGQYDTSLVYYQGVIQQIQKYVSAIKDPDRRRKWMQVLISFINSNSIIVIY